MITAKMIKKAIKLFKNKRCNSLVFYYENK